ncbi:MAG: hypothetical protein HOK80_09505 [Candidatus Cloacimonetes bacterium]|jgi:hypothetical protein|nr:hypothetical protein [Candidatus Cloacimonadota bacterium]
MSNNDQTQNQNGAVKEKKEYDGTKRPMLLVKNYKTRQAIENAQGRIDKRIAYIKKHAEEISTKYNSTETDALKKQDLLQENNKLASEIPKLKDSQLELTKKRKELEELAKETIENQTLATIDFG